MGVTLIMPLATPAPQVLGGTSHTDDTVTEQSGQTSASSFSQMLDNRSGSGDEVQNSTISPENDDLSMNKMEQTPSTQDAQTKLQLPTQQTLAKQQFINLKLQTMQDQSQIMPATTDSALSTIPSSAIPAGENSEAGMESISGDKTDETSSKESGQKQGAGATVAAPPWTQLFVPASVVPVGVSAGTTSNVNSGDTVKLGEGAPATIAGTKEAGALSTTDLKGAPAADATALKSTAATTQKPASQPEIAAGASTANGLSDNPQKETTAGNSTENTAATGKTLSKNASTFNAKSLYAQFSGIDPSLTVEKQGDGVQKTENPLKSVPSEIKAKTEVTVTLTSTVAGDVQTSAANGQQNVKTSQPEEPADLSVTTDEKASNGKLTAKPSETVADSVNGQIKTSSLQSASVSQSEGAGETASAVQSAGKEPSSSKAKNGAQAGNPADNNAGNSSESAKSGAEAGQLHRGPDQTVASESKQAEEVNKGGQNLKPEESKSADSGTNAVISNRQGEMHVNSDNRVNTTSTEAKVPTSEQLHGQIREKLESGDFRADKSSITLKLNPEELGELKINMRMDDQRLKVEIVTENRSVKEALMQNLDSLKETLSRQNISMDQFNVSADIRQGFQQNQRNDSRMMQGNGKDNSMFQTNRFSEERVQQVFNYGWENDSSLVSLVL